MIEVHKAKESPNVSKVAGFGPVCDGGSFTMVYTYATGFDNHTEVLNVVTIELTFLRLQVQIVFLKTPQNFICRLSMCCLIGTVDQNIVHIDSHLSSRYQVSKDCIYQCLEGCKQVGETEVYDAWLERFAVSDERRLPLVCFFDPDIVVPSLDVELGEDLSLCQAVDNIGGEREWVTVLDCDYIKLSVVLHEAELPIFLFDEKDWEYHW